MAGVATDNKLFFVKIYLHEEFESSNIHLSKGSKKNTTTHGFDMGNIEQDVDLY